MRLPLVFVISSILFSGSYGYPHTNNQHRKTEDVKLSDQSYEDAAAYPSEHQTEATFSHELQDDPFYPSFSQFQNQPLGHSRPFFFQQQEGAYSQRAVSPFQQQLSYETYRGGGEKYPAEEENRSLGLLGSGNFGVISGGTFYNDNDGDSTGFENRFGNFYQNGHGRPSLFLGKLAKASRTQQQQEPFANFRDFADINTPSYSQYVVVYTNKNNSNHTENHSSEAKRPKNIIEQLAMLDQETTSTTSAPEKKLSKTKLKLSLLPPEKKSKLNQLKKETAFQPDLGEPLLALS